MMRCPLLVALLLAAGCLPCCMATQAVQDRWKHTDKVTSASFRVRPDERGMPVLDYRARTQTGRVDEGSVPLGSMDPDRHPCKPERPRRMVKPRLSSSSPGPVFNRLAAKKPLPGPPTPEVMLRVFDGEGWQEFSEGAWSAEIRRRDSTPDREDVAALWGRKGPWTACEVSVIPLRRGPHNSWVVAVPESFLGETRIFHRRGGKPSTGLVVATLLAPPFDLVTFPVQVFLAIPEFH